MNGRAGQAGIGPRRGRVAVVAGTFLLLLPAGLPASASATYPGANGRIAYIATVPGETDTELFTVNPDGTGTAQLTDDDLFQTSPSWAADGSKLTFAASELAASDSSIFTMNADGSDLTHVARSRFEFSSPSFSKSGRRVLYTTDTALVTTRADGDGGRRVLRSVPSVRVGGFTEPRYSPDGRLIVFRGKPKDGAYRSGIWRMRRDGRRLRQLTRINRDSNPEFSPDGRRIVFARTDDGLLLMGRNGAGKVPIANTANFGHPDFSPAGDRIAVSVAFPHAFFEDRCGDVYSMSPEGLDLRQVTHYSSGTDGFCEPAYVATPVRAGQAAWQPLTSAVP